MIERNKIFKPIYTTNRRYILLTGGRAGAKSFEVATFLSLLTFEERQRILFTRYTMTSAEISIIPEFKEKIELLEVPNVFKVNSTDIQNVNTKSDIIFRGLKASSGMQTANLKSIVNVSCWCNDESEELVDKNIFDTIDLSIRSKQAQNRVILILNPSHKEHWIYKRWIANTHEIKYFDGYPVEISTHPDVLHIHTTYLDNLQNLDASFIHTVEKMKREAPALYAHKIIGQWREAVEGSLFPKAELKTFKHSTELENSFEGSIAYIDVADEGNDYLCCMIGRNIGTQIYITEIVFSDKNTDITIPLCVDAIKRNKVTNVRVESNSMGAMFKRNIEKELPACRVYGASSTTNKFARILNDSVFINSYFIFKHETERSATYEAALNQLSQFTKAGTIKHDDVADAASGLAIWARACYPRLYT